MSATHGRYYEIILRTVYLSIESIESFIHLSFSVYLQKFLIVTTKTDLPLLLPKIKSKSVHVFTEFTLPTFSGVGSRKVLNLVYDKFPILAFLYFLLV